MEMHDGPPRGMKRARAGSDPDARVRRRASLSPAALPSSSLGAATSAAGQSMEPGETRECPATDPCEPLTVPVFPPPVPPPVSVAMLLPGSSSPFEPIASGSRLIADPLGLRDASGSPSGSASGSASGGPLADTGERSAAAAAAGRMADAEPAVVAAAVEIRSPGTMRSLMLSPVSVGHDVRVESELVSLGFSASTVRAAMRAIRDQEGAAIAARCCATVERNGLAPIIGCETFRLALTTIASATQPLAASLPPPPPQQQQQQQQQPLATPRASSGPRRGSLVRASPVPVHVTDDDGFNGSPGLKCLVPAGNDPEDPEAAVCCICLDPLSRGTRALFITTCSHAFHYACIRDAVESRVPACPLCRRSFTSMTPPARIQGVPRRAFSSGDLGTALAAARAATRLDMGDADANNGGGGNGNGNGNNPSGIPRHPHGRGGHNDPAMMLVPRPTMEGSHAQIAQMLRGGSAARRARLAEMQRAHRQDLEVRRAMDRGVGDAPAGAAVVLRVTWLMLFVDCFCCFCFCFFPALSPQEGCLHTGTLRVFFLHARIRTRKASKISHCRSIHHTTKN
jgi:hypothetical protein